MQTVDLAPVTGSALITHNRITLMMNYKCLLCYIARLRQHFTACRRLPGSVLEFLHLILPIASSTEGRWLSSVVRRRLLAPRTAETVRDRKSVGVPRMCKRRAQLAGHSID